MCVVGLVEECILVCEQLVELLGPLGRVSMRRRSVFGHLKEGLLGVGVEVEDMGVGEKRRELLHQPSHGRRVP